MATCPNVNSQEWLDFVDQSGGDERAYFLWDLNDGFPMSDNDLYDPQTDELPDRELLELHRKQVLSLVNRRKELEGETDTVKRSVTWSNIESIKASIESLQKEISYSNIINVALKNLKEAGKLLNKKELDGKESLYIKSTLDRLVTLDGVISSSKVSIADVKRKEYLRTTATDLLLGKWKSLNVNLMEKVSTSEGRPMSFVDLAEKPIKDIGVFTTYALSLTSTNVPILRLMDSRFQSVKRKTNNVMFAFNKQFEAIKKKYGSKEDFKKLLDDKGRLITQTKGSYFDEEREMLDGINQALENSKGSKQKSIIFSNRDKWYKERNNYTLSPEGELLFKERLAALQERLAFENEDEQLTDENIEYIDRWAQENSPYLGLAYANSTNAKPSKGNYYWYRYLNQTPKAEYINDKYDAIKDDELYKFVVNTITDGMKKVPHRMLVDLNSFDKVLNSILFDFNKEDKMILKAAWDGVGDFFNDTFRKAITQQDVYGYSGKIVDEKGVVKEKLYPKGITEIQQEKQFENPLDLVKDFFHLSTAYEHKSEIEAEIWLLKGLLDEQKAIRVSSSGIAIKEGVIEGGLFNAQKLAMTNILSELYDKRRLDVESIEPTDKEKAAFKVLHNKWLEDKKLAWISKQPFNEPEPVLHKVSAVKTIDAIVDGTRINLLWLKPLSAVTNLLIGVQGNFLHAARKLDFTDEDLFYAFKLLGNSTLKYSSLGKVETPIATKIKNMSNLMGISEETFMEDMKSYSSKIVSFGLTWQTSGEYIIANQIMIAKMNNEKIKNLAGEEKSLWSAFDTEGNFNTAEFGEMDEMYIKKIKDRIREIRQQSQGDYQSALGVKSKVAGRVLMLFRTWLPRAINNRFGEQIGDDFKGRYVTYRDVYQSYVETNGFWQGVGKMAGTQFLATLTKIGNIPGLSQLGMKSLSDLCNEKYEADLKKMGLSDLDIQNMRVNIRELQYIVYMSLIVMTLAAMAGDEPPEKDLTMSINLATRLYQDMSFFYSFNSATSITKDPIPIYKTIQDGYALIGNTMNYLEDPNSDIYERGRHEGGSKVEQSLYKLVPGLSAYQSTLNTMDQVFSNKGK